MTQLSKKLAEKIALYPRIAALPRERKGLPVPFIVLQVKGREPDFTVNNSHLVEECLQEGKCSICGEQMGSDVWFIGGPGSGLDPRGAYRDPPVHHECGTFALEVCPYLAVRAYSGMKPAVRMKVLQEIVESGGPLGFVDQTVSSEKPTRFIFAKTSGFHAFTDNGRVLLTPNRPFEEIEEWVDGQLVDAARPGDKDYADKLKSYRKQGLENMKKDRIQFSQLPSIKKNAWLGKFSGIFPWNK